MNTNWVSIVILYLWFLAGLYGYRLFSEESKESLLLVASSFFLGPISLLIWYVRKHEDELRERFFPKPQAPVELESREYEQIVLLDAEGRDPFAADGAKSPFPTGIGSGVVIGAEGVSKKNDGMDDLKKLLYEALTSQSRDIFIDPENNADCQIRLRSREGDIRQYAVLPQEQARSVIALIKTAARMNGMDRNLPQNGIFKVLFNEINTSFRAATVAVLGGEKMSIRIIGSDRAVRHLGDLGLLPDQLQQLNEGLKLPSGLILICGPQGSGKTTTMYALMRAMDCSSRNVISLEGAVKQVIPGISQLEVKAGSGMSYGTMLKNALQMNPDVICAEKIPDRESVGIAVQSAVSGRLVIAGLDQISCADILTWLSQRGVSFRSMAESLQLIVSQLLIRKLCPHCRRKAILNKEQLAFCESYGIDPNLLYNAGGCPECDHTGFSDNQAVFEIVTVTPRLRSLLVNCESGVPAIVEYLENNPPGNTIYTTVGAFLLNGEISLAEFQRVCGILNGEQ